MFDGHLNFLVSSDLWTGRKRLTYMSSSLERNYGKYLTDVTLEQYKDSIISDPSTNAVNLIFSLQSRVVLIDIQLFFTKILAQIYRVGNRICQANGLPPHKYYLIKAKLPNAFVFGAETVFVFEGTLD
jgi:Zn-dependent protease with chaperone function